MAKERKAMSKSEFARTEFGKAKFSSLYEKIKLNQDLLEELEAAHYNKTNKMILPKHQLIILKYYS